MWGWCFWVLVGLNYLPGRGKKRAKKLLWFHGCETGTFLSDLAANICLLRLLVLLLSYSCRVSCLSDVLHVSARCFGAVQVPFPAERFARRISLCACAGASHLRIHGTGLRIWIQILFPASVTSWNTPLVKKMPIICGMEMSSKSLFSFKVCGQTNLYVKEMGETHEEVARRLYVKLLGLGSE